MTAAEGRGQVLAALPGDLSAKARAIARDWAGSAQPGKAGHAGSASRAPGEAALAGRVSPATLRAYLADWAAFAAWSSMCESGISPAQAAEVAVYLAAAACATGPAGSGPRYRPGTLLRWASSISAVHAALGFHDPCAEPPARQVVTAIRDLPAGTTRRLRPLLAGDVHALLSCPPQGTSAESARRRDRLIVALGFAAGLGPSGLTGLTLARVRPVPGEHALALHEHTIGPAEPPLTCPVCAWTSWRELVDLADTSSASAVRALTSNAKPASAAGHLQELPGPVPAARCQLPLLRRIRRGGTITADPLTAQVIKQVLRRLAADAGVNPAAVTGLSLRAAHHLDRIVREASAMRA